MKFQKGMIPWNKGLPAWNRGTKGVVKTNSGSYKKGHISLFRAHNDESKRKISLANKGKKPSIKALENSLKVRLERKGHWHYKKRQKKIKTEEEKRYRNWQKNKRNRVIKRLKIESKAHSFGEWELLKKQYGYTCPCCKKNEPIIQLTEDHIIPLSKGGSDIIENIQPLCLSCNLRKHTKIIKY